MIAEASGGNLRRSPLDSEHRTLGAKMVAFGGWEMPLSYPGGTIAEHLACRRSAVAFDVSHLGTVRIEGAGGFELLQTAFSNDLRKIEPGHAQYTHLLDDSDASVLDDVIVWWVDRERFDVMPNASNTARVTDALGTGRDVTAERAVIAVQGPEALPVAAKFLPQVADLERNAVRTLSWEGVELVVAATGYTGERGCEISVPAAGAAAVWEAVLAAGALPAGLGARDTLRLEAGLPLHGHELGPGITPLQAGLGWVVGWDKGDFRGRGALAAERQRGVARRLRGIVTEGRRPPREGQGVRVGEGPAVGVVTSGNFSPILGRGIALAFLPPDVDLGSRVVVLGREELPGEVVRMPFLRAFSTQ